MHSDTTLYFDVPRPDRLSRLLIFVRWLLIIPHALILWAYGILAGIASFIGWWVVLFTGQYPVGLWSVVFSYVRWNTRVTVYMWMLRDEYPPFGDEPYPIQLHLERPARQSRLLVLGRFITLIPLALWLSLVGLYAGILLIIAFVAILGTGNIPAGVCRDLVGILGYALKVNTYAYVLTDAWPGFSFRR
jgi:hypothetical protein